MLRLWFIVLTIISASKLASADSKWELAAALSDKIDLIDKSGLIIDYFDVEDGQVTALAYDPKHKELYFTNTYHPDYSIFQLDPFNHSSEHIPIVTKQTEGAIESLAIDTMARTLYWAVGNKIKYLPWDSMESPGAGIVLHTFTDYKPFGLAIDVCNRMLYWTNQYNHTKKLSLIQKSKLLSAENETIEVFRTQSSAYGIVIDHSTNRVYWSEEEEGSHMYIKSLSLHGNNPNEEPQVHVEHTNGHRPTSLTKLDSNFFWTDEWSKKFFTAEKINDVTKIVSLRMHTKKNYDTRVFGIISMKQSSYIDPDNCHRENPVTTERMQEDNPKLVESHYGDEVQYIERNGQKLMLCPDNRSEPIERSSCDGMFPNECYNFCLNEGLCEVIDDKPKCTCKQNWDGERCELKIDVCSGYCHNGGVCYFDEGSRRCNCTDKFEGEQCEKLVVMEEYVCIAHCSLMTAGYDHETAVEILSSHVIPDKIRRSSCRCSDYNIQKPVNSKSGSSDESNKNKTVQLPAPAGLNEQLEAYECSIDTWMSVIIIVLSIVCLLLMAVTAVLVNKVMSLRKRPRIKKRIIVNKKLTPLTSRPQATEQCEITIENCCNMNICETPCFEPDFRKPHDSEKSKKEEKKSLLTAIDLPPDDLY